jgi:hypothetical protein
MDEVTLRGEANFPRRQEGVEPTEDEASDEAKLVFATQIDNHPGCLFDRGQQRLPGLGVQELAEGRGVVQVDGEGVVVNPAEQGAILLVLATARGLIHLRRGRLAGDARCGITKPVEHGLHGCPELVVILGGLHPWQGRDECRIPVDVLIGQVGMLVADCTPDFAKADEALGALGVGLGVGRPSAGTRERYRKNQQEGAK